MWSANGWLANLQPYIDAHPGLRRPGLPAPVAGGAVAQGRPVLGAVLRRVLVPDVPQGPDGPGRDHDAGAPDLVPGGADRGPDATTPRRGGPGICLRGDPGWGENLAPIDTAINTFGGRWFDLDWRAQLTSPRGRARGQSYVRCRCCRSTASRRRAGRLLRVRHAVRPGRRGHVVRRHVGGGRRSRTRRAARWSGADRLRLGAEPERPARPAGCTPGRWRSRSHLPAQAAAWDFMAWMTSKSVHPARWAASSAGRTCRRAAGSRPTRSRSTRSCPGVFGPTDPGVDQTRPTQPSRR